jgi:hypothetical protein
MPGVRVFQTLPLPPPPAPVLELLELLELLALELLELELLELELELELELLELELLELELLELELLELLELEPPPASPFTIEPVLPHAAGNEASDATMSATPIPVATGLDAILVAQPPLRPSLERMRQAYSVRSRGVGSLLAVVLGRGRRGPKSAIRAGRGGGGGGASRGGAPPAHHASIHRIGSTSPRGTLVTDASTSHTRCRRIGSRRR